MTPNFEVNQGQSDPQVLFIGRGADYGLFLTATEAVLVGRKASATVHTHRLPPSVKAVAGGSVSSPPPSVGESEGGGAVVRMQLVDANPTPQVAALEELVGKVNYFIGNNPGK